MEILLWFQSIHNPFLDAFFNMVTFLGDEVTVVLLIAWYLWCHDRSFGIKLGTMFFCSGVVAQLLKVAVNVPRPWVLEPRLMPGALAVSHASGASFPSGHTMAATVLFGALFLRVRHRGLKAACVLAILVTCVSRMYLLVHTLQDVMFSLVFGTGLVFLSWFVDRVQKRDMLIKSIYLTAAVLACLLEGLCLYRLFTGQDDGINSALSASGATLGFLLGILFTKDAEYNTKAAWHIQAAKMAAGLTVSVAMMVVIPALLMGIPFAYILAYTLISFWVSAAFPALVKRLSARVRM